MRKNAECVTLIGAGPGDPGLITAKGLDRLRSADVVVHDALVHPRLITLAKPGARLVDAGKRGRLPGGAESGGYRLSQDQINDLLVDLARQGLKVVRLKGGDPYLFGRGAEEAAYLARHGIACEVIPGVTSGIAAPMYAGIAVTHRELASSVTFVTGHEDPDKPGSRVDYRALAGLIDAGGTACFYMGVGRLSGIVASLTKYGLPAAMPAAAVQWGTWTTQRSVRGTLGGIEGLVKQHALGSPAIIVVGNVAAMDEPGLDFFTTRPLFGQRVLVTRTRQQASALSAELEALGAEVIEAPTICITPLAKEELEQLDATLRAIDGYDWLILTSPNAAEVLHARLINQGKDARALAGVKLAAVGEATAEALKQKLGVQADFVPRRAMGEALGRELIATHPMAGQRVMLLRADLAGEDLPKLLEQAGAQVRQVVGYRTVMADSLPAEVAQALKAGRVDWLTFTSSSTVRNLVGLLGADRGVLAGIKTASIGPVTSGALGEAGLDVTVEAGRSSVAGLVEAMCGGGTSRKSEKQESRQ